MTVQNTWTISFHLIVIIFLYNYEENYLNRNFYLKRNGQQLFPNRFESPLLYSTQNQCSLLNSINLIILSFYIADALYDLNELNICDAINKLLISCLVICFDQFR